MKDPMDPMKDPMDPMGLVYLPTCKPQKINYSWRIPWDWYIYLHVNHKNQLVIVGKKKIYIYIYCASHGSVMGYKKDGAGSIEKKIEEQKWWKIQWLMMI